MKLYSLFLCGNSKHQMLKKKLWLLFKVKHITQRKQGPTENAWHVLPIVILNPKKRKKYWNSSNYWLKYKEISLQHFHYLPVLHMDWDLGAICIYWAKFGHFHNTLKKMFGCFKMYSLGTELKVSSHDIGVNVKVELANKYMLCGKFLKHTWKSCNVTS